MLNHQEVMDQLTSFLEENYEEEILDLDSDSIRQSIIVDYRKITQFNEELAETLLENYGDIEDSLELSVIDSLVNIGVEENKAEQIVDNTIFRIKGIESDEDNIIQIRNFRSEHINQLVVIEGKVKQATAVVPKIEKGAFKCKRCSTLQHLDQPINPRRQEEPFECQSCESRDGFKIKPRDSKIADFQKLTIGEPPEDLRGGKEPEDITVYIRGDITGIVDPGDRIKLSGILRSGADNDSNVLRKFIHGKYIKKEDKGFEELTISDEDKKTILDLSKQDDIKQKIIESIAPEIYGRLDMKEAIALQLFSGVQKAEGSYIRGDIHTLAIGDPGTAKSRLLQRARTIAPRGIYAVGKGSSAAGLTASAVKDSDITGDEQWSLEAGALVLADKGLAAIDEVDKMRDEDRSALHEALEDQQVSINKASINTTLQSRCSLAAAANPTDGRFKPGLTINKQINLEPALISRFDLIFTIRDEPDEEIDEELADTIVYSNRKQDPEVSEEELENVQAPIDTELLRKYVAYARQEITPTLTDEAHRKITGFYLKIRNSQEESNDEGRVPITAREIQSIIRLSEAHARMHLSEEVRGEDVEAAKDIKRRYLEDVAIDPETGELDAGVIEAGVSASQREKINRLKEIISSLEEENEEYNDMGVPEEKIVEEAVKTSEIDDEDWVKDQLLNWQTGGELIEPSTGHFRLV